MSEVEIPQTWTQTALGQITQVDSGIGFPNEYQGITTGDLPFFKVGDVSNAVLNNNGRLTVGKHYVSLEVANILRGKPLKPGSTVFAKIGEAIRLNRRGYVTTDCLIDNNVMAVKALLDESDRYIHYFLRTVQFTDVLRATTVPSLRKGDVEGLQIPLAPLPEQKRIADKLDSVLARVDACRDRLDRLPALLKRFRQSILTAATSGRLTEAWRQNATDAGELPAGWTSTTINEITAELRYGTSKKCDYEEIGKPVLRIPNMSEHGRLNLKDIKYAEFDAGEIRKLSLQTGDILIIRSNGSLDLVGKSCVVENDAVGQLFAGYLIRLRVEQSLALPRYVYLCLTGPEQRQRIELISKSTSGVNNINSEEVRSLPLLLPPLPEQTEIVRRVEILFAFADRLEARLATARRQVGQLTPALLAKAFRGELVAQDPADEPAAELLKRLAAQREVAPKVKRGRARG